MQITSFFISIFFLSLIITITIYSILLGFGPNSKNLLDPFEENQN